MTTCLSSNVSVGYFSWVEYDIMAPVQPKTEKTLAAAFISNCVASNFRLQALNGLEKVNIKIDSYGGLSCAWSRDILSEFVDVTKPVELEKEVKDMESDVHGFLEATAISSTEQFSNAFRFIFGGWKAWNSNSQHQASTMTMKGRDAL
ncbi:glycoprotein 3-alpha-L-fucosyltransferase A-like protein [Tanacetum coccineum]